MLLINTLEFSNMMYESHQTLTQKDEFSQLDSHLDNDDCLNSQCQGSDMNPEYDCDRVEKSRERNREHAKKTRLRKKVMLEGLKSRLLELQNEVSLLSYPVIPVCDFKNFY